MDFVLIAFYYYCNIELTVLLYMDIWHPKSRNLMLRMIMKPQEPWLAHDLKNLHIDTGQPSTRSRRVPSTWGRVTELMKGNQVTGMTAEEERGSKNPRQESCKNKRNQVFSHGGDLPSHLSCCYSNRKETHTDSWIDKVYRQPVEPDPLLKTKSKLLWRLKAWGLDWAGPISLLSM